MRTIGLTISRPEIFPNAAGVGRLLQGFIETKASESFALAGHDLENPLHFSHLWLL
jgi:hypothetical protein